MHMNKYTLRPDTLTLNVNVLFQVFYAAAVGVLAATH